MAFSSMVIYCTLGMGLLGRMGTELSSPHLSFISATDRECDSPITSFGMQRRRNIESREITFILLSSFHKTDISC